MVAKSCGSFGALHPRPRRRHLGKYKRLGRYIGSYARVVIGSVRHAENIINVDWRQQDTIDTGCRGLE